MISFLPGWLTTQESSALFEAGKALPLAQHSVLVWEKQHLLPRLTCYFDDRGTGYRYSGQTTAAESWTPELLAVRGKLEQQFEATFGACLVNFYRSEKDTVGWHRDNEHIFGPRPKIASLSCGAARKFRMRNRQTGEKQEFWLGAGDLLVFTDEHVSQWEHCVPRTAKPTGERINFTFRSID